MQVRSVDLYGPLNMFFLLFLSFFLLLPLLVYICRHTTILLTDLTNWIDSNNLANDLLSLSFHFSSFSFLFLFHFTFFLFFFLFSFFLSFFLSFSFFLFLSFFLSFFFLFSFFLSLLSSPLSLLTFDLPTTVRFCRQIGRICANGGVTPLPPSRDAPARMQPWDRLLQ